MNIPLMITRVIMLMVMPLTLAGALEARLLASIKEAAAAGYPRLAPLYEHLHANPELSFQEEGTAARLAQELRGLGYEVTTGVGGHGVVAVLENGDGPTVMLRADMDALPVKEETGVEYASHAMATDDGREVAVMHACGHDVHMTCLIGTAGLLAAMKADWSGTLVLILQPAEERGAGAEAMIEAGLFDRFPRPDAALALHVDAELEAGKLGYIAGFAMANVDSVDVTVRGVGGHGAYPHLTKDPVVITANIIMALQTVISRELNPIDPAVITVGSIHGGAKHNVIADECKLQLTVRSYSDETRDYLLSAIERVATNTARTHGVPEDRLPIVEVKDEYTPALYNSPELVEKTLPVIRELVGEENVIELRPVMGGEDFGRYGRDEPRIPIFMFRLGAVSKERMAEAKRGGEPLPSLHSARFCPDPKPTITTGVAAFTAAAMEQFSQR